MTININKINVLVLEILIPNRGLWRLETFTVFLKITCNSYRFVFRTIAQPDEKRSADGDSEGGNHQERSIFVILLIEGIIYNIRNVRLRLYSPP